MALTSFKFRIKNAHMNKKKNFKSNQNESPPLFSNKWLDMFTRTHIAIPVGLFFLYAAGLIYYAYVATDLSMLAIIGLFFAGWFVFTFVEYQVHMRLYHLEPSTEKRKEIAYKFHGIHHDYPKDKQRLAMPPVMSVAIGTVLLFLFELILDKYSFGFLAGFMVGYAFYLLVHYSVHIFRPPFKFLKPLWTNHAVHHYKDDTVYFGVSSPLWDYILGTRPEKEDKKPVEVSAS